MATGSIGAITGITFQGDRIRRAERSTGVIAAAPGELGPIASRSSAWVSPVCRVQTLEIMADGTTATQAADRVEAVRGYAGTTQTVVDQFGESFSGCFILRSAATRALMGAKWCVMGEWEILVPPTTATPPA